MTWYLLALLSAVFIALTEFTEKKALTKEHASAFLTVSSFIILIFSLPLLLTGKIQIVTGPMLGLIFFKSVLAVLAITFTTMALRHMEVSEFSPLLNLSPLFLLVISVFFLGEKVSNFQSLGIVLIVLGTYILEFKQTLKSPFERIKSDKYIHLLLLGAVFLSLTAALDRVILLKSINVETFYLYQRVFITALFVIITFYFYEGMKDIKEVTKRSFMIVLIPSVLYAVGDYIYFMAVAMPAALIALIIPIKRTSNLITTMMGGELLKEERVLQKSLACIIMLLGVVLIILK
ncbi:MAG: EamA family transporter [Patescibacteria group bacterium]|nr:EamA family transporter [Patescibacteria group bacterium]